MVPCRQRELARRLSINYLIFLFVAMCSVPCVTGVLSASACHPPPSQDNDGWIPLFLSVQDSDCPPSTALALLDAWPQGAHVTDVDGKCALHYAAEHGADPSVVKILIEHNPLVRKSLRCGVE